MAFKHEQHGVIGGLEAPVKGAVDVVPDDSNDLTWTTRAIYVGVSGDISVHMYGESAPLVWKNVPVGFHPISVDRILSTGTTAASLIASW